MRRSTNSQSPALSDLLLPIRGPGLESENKRSRLVASGGVCCGPDRVPRILASYLRMKGTDYKAAELLYSKENNSTG